ncbi:hypothetical protein VTN00DRAFT_1379 [Thermoascus crustaceus]|uniref:uncharacterized protein n=1 Tax=Thermoascus crustaceus TaxID=5088 RepID=UPI003743D25F
METSVWFCSLQSADGEGPIVKPPGAVASGGATQSERGSGDMRVALVMGMLLGLAKTDSRLMLSFPPCFCGEIFLPETPESGSLASLDRQPIELEPRRVIGHRCGPLFCLHCIFHVLFDPSVDSHQSTASVASPSRLISPTILPAHPVLW